MRWAATAADFLFPSEAAPLHAPSKLAPDARIRFFFSQAELKHGRICQLAWAGWLFVDGGNEKVGIGTSSPTEALDIDSNSIRLRQDLTPSSASDTGSAGQIAWDPNYIYVCVATDTWKRVAIGTW